MRPSKRNASNDKVWHLLQLWLRDKNKRKVIVIWKEKSLWHHHDFALAQAHLSLVLLLPTGMFLAYCHIRTSPSKDNCTVLMSSRPSHLQTMTCSNVIKFVYLTCPASSFDEFDGCVSAVMHGNMLHMHKLEHTNPSCECNVYRGRRIFYGELWWLTNTATSSWRPLHTRSAHKCVMLDVWC